MVNKAVKTVNILLELDPHNLSNIRPEGFPGSPDPPMLNSPATNSMSLSASKWSDSKQIREGFKTEHLLYETHTETPIRSSVVTSLHSYRSDEISSPIATPLWDLPPDLYWAVKPHATTSSLNISLSHFPPRLHGPLRTGPWYTGRDPSRSDDPFDTLFTRQEWDSLCEQEEQRKRDEMTTTRARGSHDLQPSEAPTNGGPAPSVVAVAPSPSLALLPSTRTCKTIKVKAKGGRTRAVTLWCKGRVMRGKAAGQHKTATRKRKSTIHAEKSLKPKPRQLGVAVEEGDFQPLSGDYLGSHRGVAGHKTPR
ncbi:hypothetical protein V5O48_003914 [Marasmius crinis-equi]|uniref:Uncharacterized protein n=1 Tax=Marasmius crinis-equi TaxID=585013 RepID=A0ABR3FRN0_9AGAR